MATSKIWWVSLRAYDTPASIISVAVSLAVLCPALSLRRPISRLCKYCRAIYFEGFAGSIRLRRRVKANGNLAPTFIWVSSHIKVYCGKKWGLGGDWYARVPVILPTLHYCSVLRLSSLVIRDRIPSLVLPLSLGQLFL